MFLTTTWKDFEVLDTGDGEKLERWGGVILRRPDPQTIWPKADPALWKQAQAHYHRSERGGGEWEFFTRLPERWTISHQGLKFYVRPTGFKHTGLFPEQGRELGLDGGKDSGKRPQRREGAEPVWLYRRRNAGVRSGWRDCHPRGRGQGHGAMGEGEPRAVPAAGNQLPLDRRGRASLRAAGDSPGQPL